MSRHTLGWRIAQQRREKAVREGRDITQADLAEAIKASPTSVSEWEADKKKPRDPTLARIAKYLDTTEAYLVYGVTDARPPVQKGPDVPSAKERAEFVNAELEAARKEREKAERGAASTAAGGTKGRTRRR